MLRRMVGHTIDIGKAVSCCLSATEIEIGLLIYIPCAKEYMLPNDEVILV
jgi:hypothetical protein